MRHSMTGVRERRKDKVRANQRGTTEGRPYQMEGKT